MNADRDRDRLLEDALRHELRATAALPRTEACLDAETVAAWMDGGLDPPAIAVAKTHAASCARCQALLGSVARTLPAPAATPAHGARLWRWWFAPLAATAAAVTVWMVVPQGRLTAPPAPAAVESAAPQSVPARAGTEAAATPPAPAAQSFEARERRAEAAKLADVAAEGRVAATAPPAVAPRAQAAEATETAVTARSSPSPGVIWTVGRAGMVRLATDGLTFVRVPFPESVDLTAVTATDQRHATVTAADGRTFRTADGGRTWTRP